MGSGGKDVSACQTSIGATLYGAAQNMATNYWMAEKIVVPASGWMIDSLVNYGYQTNSGNTSTFTGHFCFISLDSAGMPSYTPTIGSRSTNAMVYSNWTGIYRTTTDGAGMSTDVARPIMKLKSNLSGILPAGTYWVVWSATGSGASGPWSPPVTVLGNLSTGNAMQFTPTGWTASLDGSSNLGAPFKLYGSVLLGVKKAEVFVNSVSVSPNPVATTATVKIELAKESGLTESNIAFVVVDIQGKEVLNYSSIPSSSFEIVRGDLSAGTYTYKVINKNNGSTLKTDKLIVQ